jgi:hypothetical protein
MLRSESLLILLLLVSAGCVSDVSRRVAFVGWTGETVATQVDAAVVARNAYRDAGALWSNSARPRLHLIAADDVYPGEEPSTTVSAGTPVTIVRVQRYQTLSDDWLEAEVELPTRMDLAGQKLLVSWSTVGEPADRVLALPPRPIRYHAPAAQ